MLTWYAQKGSFHFLIIVKDYSLLINDDDLQLRGYFGSAFACEVDRK